MTLRLRLSMLAVVLVAAGLLVAGIATRYELRGFLIDRVDSQLASAAAPVSIYFARGDTDPGAQGPVLGVLPQGSYAAVVITGGSDVAAPSTSARGRHPRTAARGDQAPGGTSTQGDYRVYVTPGQPVTARHAGAAGDRDAAARRQLDAQPAGHAGAAGRPDRAGGGGGDRLLAGATRAAAAGADRGHGRGDRRRRPHTARAGGGARYRGR